MKYCFTCVSVSTQIQPHRSSLHPRAEMFTHEITERTSVTLFKKESALTLVERGKAPSISSCGEQKQERNLTNLLRKTAGFPSTTYTRKHAVVVEMTKIIENRLVAYLWFSQSLSFVVRSGWNSTGECSVQRGRRTPRYKGLPAKYNLWLS